MQTQRHLWLKIVIAGVIVLGVVYFFAQPSKKLSFDNSDKTEKIQSTPFTAINENNNTNNQVTTKISSTASSSESQALTRELQERITAIQQRRPNLKFSNNEIAAAVNRTASWAPSEEIPRELPLQPEEFTDGRQFIELDSLKIETLMPGDKINVQVDNNAKHYQVTIDRIEKHDYNSISWFGHIQGDDGQKYSVSFTRGEQLTVGGLDTPDGHYVLQGHGDKGWVASSQLLFKADTSVSDAIHPEDVDPNYAKNQEVQPHNH